MQQIGFFTFIATNFRGERIAQFANRSINSQFKSKKIQKPQKTAIAGPVARF